MPIQIACPTCQRQLRVPDNLIGEMVKCPSCQNTFTATKTEQVWLCGCKASKNEPYCDGSHNQI